MELTDEVHNKITKLTKEGDKHLKKGNTLEAIDSYQKAFDLIPEPKQFWEASTWIYTALGDAYFCRKEYNKAFENLNLASKCPNGSENPFILLRLGQCFFEADNMVEAKRYFAFVYSIAGQRIFLTEDPKYFNLLT